jgi:integrase
MGETAVKKRRKRRPGLVGTVRDIRKRKDLPWNWQYAWTDLGGKAHYEYFMNKDDARRLRFEKTEARRKGLEVAPSEDTLATHADAWLKSKIRDRAADEAQEEKPKTNRSMAWAVARLKRGLGEVRLSDMTGLAIKEFALSLREAKDKPLKAATVGNLLSYLNQILEEAVAQRVLHHNPMADYRRAQPKRNGGGAKKKAPICSEAEMERFTGVALDLYPPERSLWGVMLTLALYTGLREGELLGLKWEHAHLEGDAPYLDVHHGWDPKLGFVGPKTSASYRQVPLPAVVKSVLKPWRTEGHSLWNQSRERLHMAERVCPAAPQSYIGAMRHVLEAAGLGFQNNLHLLRHQYISAMAQRGVPPFTLKTWAGHSSIEMTMDYYAKPMDFAPAVYNEYLGGFGDEEVLARKVPSKVTLFRKTQAA